MSQFKKSPRKSKQNESNERSPQVARQISQEQPSHSSNLVPEAFGRPMFQHPLQGSLVYLQQPTSLLSPRSPQAPPQIRMPNPNQNFNFGRMAPVDLIVSNLDMSIDAKEVSLMLLNMFRQHCTILNLQVVLQNNTLIANVKVGNHAEAQAAISYFDSRLLGCKRISVSYLVTGIDQLRMVVISLLKNVPGQSMPLFKFFEIVRSRYLTNVSLSDINYLEDICKITDGANGRMISLNQNSNSMVPLPVANTLNYYCMIHCPSGSSNQGWGEPFDFTLPNVRITLRHFQNQLHQLLLQHMGYMPLLSFAVCYYNQFKQPLPEHEVGVPLEHLVTCFNTVDLVSHEQNKNLKYLRLKDSKDIREINLDDFLLQKISPQYLDNVSRLCWEVVELLRNVEKCQLLVSAYIPSYYRHYGRQCRVADYGFNRLSDLFEAIPHVVQILGYGSKQMITLTHSVQIRRFTLDLIRTIKSQTSKKLSVELLPSAYQKVFYKEFDPIDYGVGSLEDLLCSVQEGTFTFTNIDNVDVIGLFKQEQTLEQIENTKQFAIEVKDVLRHFPYCAMPFNKFLPAYHRYFGRECKLTDCGFTRLLEAFEAIFDIVEVDGFFDMDRKIRLLVEPLLEILGSQLVSIIKRSGKPALHFDEVLISFQNTHRYQIKPEMYECPILLDVFIKLSHLVQVHFTRNGPTLSVVAVDGKVLEIQLWALLIQPPHQMDIKKLKYDYRLRFETNLPVHKLEQLKSIKVTKSEETATVTLTAFYALATRIYRILERRDGPTQLCDIPDMYFRKYSTHLDSKQYAVKTLKELLLRMNFLVVVTGRDNNLSVSLNKKLSDYGVFVLKQVKPDHTAWPPVPPHLLIGPNMLTPPKPDTPPIEGCWSDAWDFSKDSLDPYINLQIALPIGSDNRNTNQAGPSTSFSFNDDSGYSGFNASRLDASDMEANQSNNFMFGSPSRSSRFNFLFNRSPQK